MICFWYQVWTEYLNRLINKKTIQENCITLNVLNKNVMFNTFRCRLKHILFEY